MPTDALRAGVNYYISVLTLLIMHLSDRKRKILFYTILTIAAGFILLSVFVFFVPSNLLDIKFSKEVQEHQNPLLDNLMEAISWPGYVPKSPIMVLGTAALFFA